MNQEILDKFVLELDVFVKEMFSISEEESVITTSDLEIYSSLFMVTFSEDGETGFISFNDAVSTSVLLRTASVVIPYIEDGLEIDVDIDGCHFLKTDKEGIVTDVVFEDGFTKTIKVKKTK
jgi:hypothetical protein